MARASAVSPGLGHRASTPKTPARSASASARCARLTGLGGASQRRSQALAHPIHVHVGEALDTRVLVDGLLHGFDDETSGGAHRPVELCADVIDEDTHVCGARGAVFERGEHRVR